MTERKSIDMTTAARQKSLEFRLAKITTASDEVAAPYQSKASIYRGLWLDASTNRAAILTDADVWTLKETAVNDWILVVRTPFSRWEGVSTFNLPDWVIQNTEEGDIITTIINGIYGVYGELTNPGWVLGRKSDGEGGFEYGWVETVTHASQHPE
jgi:hypothetical protein